MPCYHPLIRVEEVGKWVTAQDGHKYHPAKIFNPEKYEIENLKDGAYNKHEIIPCGKCIGCRLENSRQWANRGFLEGQLWENNWFVTLTYDDENIPKLEYIETSKGYTFTEDENWGGTLEPKDIHTFMNTLRQIMKREYGETGIRYMLCGEYGGTTERPHYHIIFFNLNLPLETFFEPRVINKEIYFRNKVIERAWDKGISNISEASWNNIAYTARYITKKINGLESEEIYASKGQDQKEFFRASNRPGIGFGYYEKYKHKIYEKDQILIKNKAGIVPSKPPKYFDKLYEKEYPEQWKKIKLQRQIDGKNQNKLKINNTSIDLLDQYAIEERSKQESVQKLVRAMETQKN